MLTRKYLEQRKPLVFKQARDQNTEKNHFESVSLLIERHSEI